jgi:glutathione peroxidase-family protein
MLTYKRIKQYFSFFKLIKKKMVKYHRKTQFHYVNRSINNNFKKYLVKRTRNYIKSEDPNRKCEDDEMSRNMILSTAIS